jgi:serine/threonine protein kinase
MEAEGGRKKGGEGRLMKVPDPFSGQGFLLCFIGLHYNKDMLTRGQQIDEYIIESDSHIGDGYFSFVYKAKHVISNSLAALKVCKKNILQDDLQRFYVENDILYKLMPHDHIIAPLTEVKEEKTFCFFIMELATYGDLDKYLQVKYALPDIERLHIFKKICEGVKHAHGKNIVHRDLWWKNILMSATNTDDIPKLTDFGRAKDFDIKKPNPYRPQTTTVHEYIVPPENIFNIWNEAELIEYKSADIYALGIILRFLFGTAPIDYTTLIRSNIGGFLSEKGITIDKLYASRTEERRMLYDEWAKGFDLQTLLNQLGIQLIEKEKTDKINGIILKLSHPDYTQRYENIESLLIDIESIQ